MQIGVCTTFNDGAQLQNTVDFIEEHVQRLLVPRDDADQFATASHGIDTCPLPVPVANCFLPGDLKCVGPDRDLDAVLSYCKTVMERARELGLQTIVFGSGGARTVPDYPEEKGLPEFIETCREMAPIAQAHDITIVVEPLSGNDFINYLWEGAKIVEAVDHPNVRLLADFFHMVRNNDSPEEIRRFGELLHHVHVAEPENRTAPGVEGYDLSPYFEALAEANYDRAISMECRWNDLTAEALTGAGEIRRYFPS